MTRENMFPETKKITLKVLAERVGLAPCSVSAILNNSEASQAIPQHTKERVYRAASELNYRPNHWARSLRTRQTRMVAVLAPNFARPAVAQMITVAERRLNREGYLLVLMTSAVEDESRFCALLHQRGIEGLISVDVNAPRELTLPVASVQVHRFLEDHTTLHSMPEWLMELGESAALTLMRQIESPDSNRRINIQTAIPSPLFNMTAQLSEARAAEVLRRRHEVSVNTRSGEQVVSAGLRP